ncbi:MAG: hypothetical protein GVY02_02900 [Bacteroidetes bacterium]|jgi:hypothetical protein|nr:hypothetical protein [Bacteroidota bacterium]
MRYIFLSTVIFLAFTLSAEAQFREDLAHEPQEFTTSVQTDRNSGQPGSWMNLLNMSMNQSYSMSFSNFGGQMQNLNALSNHIYFDVSDRFQAQVDVSLLHSPFGNSFMNNENTMGAKIIIDQARLDYRISDNATITLQFSQRPGHYGYGPYGNMFSRMNRLSPWY